MVDKKNLKEKVFDYMRKKPQTENTELYKVFPDAKQDTLRRNRNLYLKEKSKDTSVVEVKANESTVQELPQELIETFGANSDILIEMIAKYRQARSIKTLLDDHEIKIEEPTKTFSYSLSIPLHTEFEKVCAKVGLSKRKALHHAMKGFIDFYNK